VGDRVEREVYLIEEARGDGRDFYRYSRRGKPPVIGRYGNESFMTGTYREADAVQGDGAKLTPPGRLALRDRALLDPTTRWERPLKGDDSNWREVSVKSSR
jgi:hypothetical protein